MTVVLDNIIFSLQKHGGISSYWAELLSRSPFYEVPYLERKDASSHPLRSGMLFRGAAVLQPRVPLCVDRLRRVRIRSIDGKLFHSSYYRVCADKDAINVTSVYDFINERYRTGIRSRMHSLQKRDAISCSRGVICISRSTYEDLKVYTPRHPGLVEVIPLGISTDYRPLKRRNNAMFWEAGGASAERRHVLFVGSRASYKNFGLVVEALRELPDYELVIVGGGELKDSETNMLHESLDNRYLFMGGVGNETLNEIYNASECLVYPSSYEGFGIPVGEAMRAGCPVIAGRVSSIPEVAGDAALYLERIGTEEIKTCLRRLSSTMLREELVGRGLARSQELSWDVTAARTWEFYERVWSSQLSVTGQIVSLRIPIKRGHEIVTRKITRTAARAARGLQNEHAICNLFTKRDWGNAGDYALAMHCRLNQQNPDIHVIATGDSHIVQEFCEIAFRVGGFVIRREGEGISKRDLDAQTGRTLVLVKQESYRPSEVHLLGGDASKRAGLRWMPDVEFEGLVPLTTEHDLREQAKSRN